MEIHEAYNEWAEQYDSNENKTRDLEAYSLKQFLINQQFENCLEIGCGTGKNTESLLKHCRQILAVDFSTNMLEKAKEKFNKEHVHFQQADINRSWDFATGTYHLLVFSLVLEHIEDIEAIFKKIKGCIASNGKIYISELHPFKQYAGSKARFENKDGSIELLTCFTHHISEFTDAARNNGFHIASIKEYFDNDDRDTIPRLLTMVFTQSGSE